MQYRVTEITESQNVIKGAELILVPVFNREIMITTIVIIRDIYICKSVIFTYVNNKKK